ncbi:hypothetical protein Maq22A_c14010 [Methylobacterium aquaticum]|uniref:Uncharacterized protein n=1 Tax=Methylobacterium aquaticum TaxID=270351 RepID=A0A0C6FG38_9HYPH|nr:hypothetical protein Maq22A_c14010 [Methylobacterium aquaticum]
MADDTWQGAEPLLILRRSKWIGMLSQRLRDWEHVKHVPPGRLQGASQDRWKRAPLPWRRSTATALMSQQAGSRRASDCAALGNVASTCGSGSLDNGIERVALPGLGRTYLRELVRLLSLCQCEAPILPLRFLPSPILQHYNLILGHEGH